MHRYPTMQAYSPLPDHAGSGNRSTMSKSFLSEVSLRRRKVKDIIPYLASTAANPPARFVHGSPDAWMTEGLEAYSVAGIPWNSNPSDRVPGGGPRERLRLRRWSGMALGAGEGQSGRMGRYGSRGYEGSWRGCRCPRKDVGPFHREKSSLIANKVLAWRVQGSYILRA